MTRTTSSFCRRLWRAVLLAGILAASGPVAQAVSGDADEVKAAYLYKFIGYIDWPDNAFVGNETPIVIGVVGADPIYAELVRVVAGRSSHGRPLAARRLAPGDAVDGVHGLYVGEPGLMRTPWLQGARDRPVLIVTDMPQGLEVGSALNFVAVQDRLRFEASLRAVERAGLKASSRLLALAQRVVAAP